MENNETSVPYGTGSPDQPLPTPRKVGPPKHSGVAPQQPDHSYDAATAPAANKGAGKMKPNPPIPLPRPRSDTK
jgi:hypothetical protein